MMRLIMITIAPILTGIVYGLPQCGRHLEIRHKLSGMEIGGKAGSNNVLWAKMYGNGNRFYIERAPESGYFYIKRLDKALCTTHTAQDAAIRYCDSLDGNAMWSYDVSTYAVRQRSSGRYIHPSGGQLRPSSGKAVVVHRSDRQEATQWIFVRPDGSWCDPDTRPVEPPQMSSKWEIVNAARQPLAEHRYTYRVRIGKSQSKWSSEQHMWRVSEAVALGWFLTNADYAQLASSAGSSTWRDEHEEERSILVRPGRTVITWQYVFIAAKNGGSDELTFRSAIFADTNSSHVEPAGF